MSSMTSNITLQALVPEIILLAWGTLIYLAGAFVPGKFKPGVLALFGLAIAAVAMFAQDDSLRMFTAGSESATQAWNTGSITVDRFGHTVRWFILLAGALLIILSDRPANDPQGPEYVGSLVLILAGLMLSATANELVMLFVGLELVSIPTYVMLYVGRRGAEAQEATTKYFFLSILSSAVLLYGFSFLYGVGGSTRLADIAVALQQQLSTTGTVSALASIGILLVFAGLGFRMTAVPFHFYAPDVYQGAGNANAGLLSTLPKIAGLVVLVRILVGHMPGLEALGWKTALVVAVMTMTLGNVVALWQNNIRRLLAYSSIAHGGYMLIGLAVGLAQSIQSPAAGVNEVLAINGVGTSLFYLATYVLATLGTFAALAYLESTGCRATLVDDLAGLGRRMPLVAVALAIFMFSLAGIPPLAGFWGKFTLMTGALDVGAPMTAEQTDLQKWFIALAIITMLNAAAAAAYYLRLVAVMYFREAEKAGLSEAPSETTFYAERQATEAPIGNSMPGRAGPLLATLICTVLVIAAGIFPNPMMEAAEAAGIAAGQRSADVPLQADQPNELPAINFTAETRSK